MIRDHAIPFKYFQDELLQLRDVTPEAVRDLLEKEILVVITNSEDLRLRANGFLAKMPPTWDGKDPRARYRAVGIELVENAPAL